MHRLIEDDWFIVLESSMQRREKVGGKKCKEDWNLAGTRLITSYIALIVRASQCAMINLSWREIKCWEWITARRARPRAFGKSNNRRGMTKANEKLTTIAQEVGCNGCARICCYYGMCRLVVPFLNNKGVAYFSARFVHWFVYLFIPNVRCALMGSANLIIDYFVLLHLAFFLSLSVSLLIVAGFLSIYISLFLSIAEKLFLVDPRFSRSSSLYHSSCHSFPLFLFFSYCSLHALNSDAFTDGRLFLVMNT